MQGTNFSAKTLGILAGFMKSAPGEKIGADGIISILNSSGRKPPLLWVFNSGREITDLATGLRHGCFRHRHQGCRYKTKPSTRPAFWQSKFEANVARDNTVRAALLAEGWRVATVWECALRKPDVRRQGFSERAGGFITEALVRFLVQLRRRRSGAASGAAGWSPS